MAKSLHFRVRYHRPAELAADYESQLLRGGLLVRVDPPAGLSLYEGVELELVAPGRDAGERLPGQVVQLLPGVGVAIAIEGAAERLAALVQASGEIEGADAPAEHEIARDEEAQPVRPARPRTRPPREVAAEESHARYRQASNSEKVQMALHGNRDIRALVMRDINKQLHIHVLRNPHIGLDEVAAIARMPTVTTDLLQQIADTKEWVRRPEIALALVRNPKMPVPTAVKLLAYVSEAECRRLTKDSNVRAPIKQAAGKRILR